MDKQSTQALIDSAAQKLSLHDICLNQSVFSLNESEIIHPGLQSEQITTLRIGEANSEITEVNPKNQPETLIYLMSYGIRVSLQNKDKSIDFATLDVIFQAAYNAAERLDESEQQAFSRINGIIHVWPYMRKHVHSTYTDAGFPAAILPMGQPRIEGITE